MSDSPTGIDPRGPRFAASITSLLLLAVVLLGLVGAETAAFVLLATVALLFAWGVAWPRTAPWGVLFRRLVRPRLASPADLEDPRPPRFAQGVGLVVSVVGLALHVVGAPWGLTVAAAAAFAAAFLNAAFGYCLGCQIYLLLQRVGLVGRSAAV